MQGEGIPGLGKGLVMGAVTQDSGGVDCRGNMGRCPEEVTRAPGCEGLCDSALSLESCGQGGGSHYPSFWVAHTLALEKVWLSKILGSKREALVRR